MATSPADSDDVLPEALRQAFDTHKVFDQHGDQVPLDSNVSLLEARQLYAIVGAIGATSTAEIGLAKGVSAMAICKAHADRGSGHHHIMDPFQQNYGNAGIAMLRRCGLEARCSFHRAFAEEVFPTLPELDFVFIDASHLFDITLLEFVLADKKLRVGGVIAFHDLWMPSLRKVLRFILTNRSYEIVTTPIAKGEQVTTRDPERGIKTIVRQLLWRLPFVGKILNPEVLHPWGNYGINNLVFVRKLASDQREWTHFEKF